MLYDAQSARMLIGCLLNNPQILNNDKYNLSKEDFEPVEFHLRLYQVLIFLARHGAKQIDSIDIYNTAEKYQNVIEIFNENNCKDFITTIKQLSSQDNIELYYNNVKRMSLLRKYDKLGYDISRFYDVDNDKDLSAGKSVDEIIEYYEGQLVKIKKEFYKNVNQEEYQAGTDFDKFKEQCKIEPLVGDSFQSEYLNDIVCGIYGFILRAAKTGGGKTVLALGDLCKVTCKEYWDYKQNKFVKNKSRTGASLFINTEMDLRKDIDPIIIAWISGVERNHIKEGFYLKGEEERVDYARKVLIDSEMYLVDDPCFTTKSLVNTIKDYKMNKQVRNVCFDYIQNNGFVASEISSETKVPQREDMVLLALTDRLKQVQRQCGIGLISSVQTNGQEDNLSFPTESCLAGGKSQARKTDATIAMLPPKANELEIFKMMQESASYPNIDEKTQCNLLTHIIKGRNSKFPKYIKIWQYADMGTARCVDLAVTDKDGKPIDVKRRVIESK